MLANHYRQLAEKPISDADFYGDDVRYSTEFECLENELNKANSLHDKQGPDWMLVRDGCEALLQSQSKDLRAAVWLTWSLYQVDSVTGLEAGLGALNYLCSQHWPAQAANPPGCMQLADTAHRPSGFRAATRRSAAEDTGTAG